MTAAPAVIAVVPAAGGSRRFGTDKQRSVVGQQALNQRSLSKPLC